MFNENRVGNSRRINVIGIVSASGITRPCTSSEDSK